MIAGNEGGFVTDSEGRLTGGVKQINANVIQWLNEAGKSLPPGWHADVAVGPAQHTQGTYTGGAQSQVPLGMAADIRLVDPNGNVMPHMVAHNAVEDAAIRASPEFKIFQKLGDAYIRASGGQGRWGGYYGLADTMQYGTVAPGYPAGSRAPPELYQGAQTTPVTTAQTQTPSPNDPRQLVYNMLTSKEIGLNPQQAVGVLWSLAGESGAGLNPHATNPNDPGTAYGIGQWILDRKANLMKFAASNNLNPADAATQVAFMKQELLSDHANALTAVRGAQTSADATGAWTRVFEVPKIDNSGERIARGTKTASLDASGNLVLPGVAGGAQGTTPAASGAQTQTPAPPTPPTLTPQQMMQMSLGQQLASLGTSTTGTSSSGIHDLPDAPPIRTPAMETPIPMPSPMPTNLGSQLGGMSTLQPLSDPSASITAGAPSMTSMLDTLGTPANFNMYDPRATQAPSLTMRSPRLA